MHEQPLAPSAVRDGLIQQLLKGPNHSIPGDWRGDHKAWFIDQVSRADETTKGSLAEAAVDLLKSPGRNVNITTTDLLRLLAETIHASPTAQRSLERLLADLLLGPVKDGDDTHLATLNVLGRCSFPGRNWQPLIQPHLMVVSHGQAAYLALLKQHPDTARPYYPQVLALMNQHALPTGLFEFVVNQRTGPR